VEDSNEDFPVRIAIYEHGAKHLQVKNAKGLWVNIPEVNISHDTLENDPVLGGPETRFNSVRLRELKGGSVNNELHTKFMQDQTIQIEEQNKKLQEQSEQLGKMQQLMEEMVKKQTSK
jgi:hypothetical protein